MHAPMKTYLETTKNIFKYVKTTLDMSLVPVQCKNFFPWYHRCWFWWRSRCSKINFGLCVLIWRHKTFYGVSSRVQRFGTHCSMVCMALQTPWRFVWAINTSVVFNEDNQKCYQICQQSNVSCKDETYWIRISFHTEFVLDKQPNRCRYLHQVITKCLIWIALSKLGLVDKIKLKSIEIKSKIESSLIIE